MSEYQISDETKMEIMKFLKQTALPRLIANKKNAQLELYALFDKKYLFRFN